MLNNKELLIQIDVARPFGCVCAHHDVHTHWQVAYDPHTVQTNLALAPDPSFRCSVILPHLQQSQPLLK